MKQLFGKYYDKALHAIAGILIAVIVISVMKLLTNWQEFYTHVAAFLAVVLAAFAKEVYDQKIKGHRADEFDAIATFLGGFLIILIDKFLI